MTTLTMNPPHTELFRHHKLNTILTAANWPYQVNSIFNGATLLAADDTTLLLCRVENRSSHSHLCAARSANGIDSWVIDSKPTFIAATRPVCKIGTLGKGLRLSLHNKRWNAC
jgi:predicted GH43/DUF377 family glycosyl hydrolase